MAALIARTFLSSSFVSTLAVSVMAAWLGGCEADASRPEITVQVGAAAATAPVAMPAGSRCAPPTLPPHAAAPATVARAPSGARDPEGPHKALANGPAVTKPDLTALNSGVAAVKPPVTMTAAQIADRDSRYAQWEAALASEKDTLAALPESDRAARVAALKSKFVLGR